MDMIMVTLNFDHIIFSLIAALCNGLITRIWAYSNLVKMSYHDDG